MVPEDTTILMIEDNELHAKLMRDILEPRGYNIVAANNGEEGLMLFNAFKPNLVLLDMQLPQMDGYQIIAKLRETTAGRTVVVLAVSAYSAEFDRKKAIDAGCDGYVTKPVSPRRMPIIVTEALEKGREGLKETPLEII